MPHDVPPSRLLNKKELYAFTRTLEKPAKHGERTLNDLTYDDVPLWWLYKIRFFRDALPRPFDNFESLIRVQSWSMTQKKMHFLKRKMQGIMLARGLLINEKCKQLFSRRSTPLPPANTKRSRVLFLVHSIAMDVKNKAKNEFAIDRIDSVFRAAQKEVTLDAQVLVIDAMSQFASPTTAGYPHFFHQYVDDTIIATAQAHARRLHQEWIEIKKGLCRHELFPLFEPALDFFFSEQFITITIKYYETFKKIFSHTQARALLIYAPAGVLDRCAIKATDSVGIPTIALFPGMGLSSTEWTYGKNNFFLVNSPIEREQCITLGAPKENVTAIGPITFAEIYQYQKQAEKRNRQFEGIKKGQKQETQRPRILFCTAPMIQEGAISEQDYFSHVRRFIRELAAVNNGRCDVVIKPHPLEKQEYIKQYQKIINQKKLNNARVVCGGLGKKVLYEEIAACDAFVCFFSTVLFEASVLDKPVILIELYDRHRIDESGQFYRNSDAVIKAKPTEPVRPVVENILFNEPLRKKLAAKRKAFNQMFCYKADAHAPKRAVEYMKKMVGER